jgi:hypothetical protein
MATPIFNLRLSEKTQTELREIARIYGAPSAGGFVREMIEVMVSGNPERLKDFNRRLMSKVGEQLALNLNAVVDSVLPEPPRPPAKPIRKARKGRRVRR